MSKQSFTTGQVLTSAEMTQLQANDYNQTVSAKVASYTLVASDAGTRITMANVAATSITVNTALFTAGDTLTITNISSGVCTITAGTATVSTAGSLALQQYDSGTLYFTSTGVSIWNGANPGDITGVTAGTGITGGGSSGTVTVTNDMATTITTNGDLIYGTGSGTYTRRAIGSSAQVLTVTGGIPTWATPATTGFIGCSVTKSAVQSIANNTSTVLTFNGELFDTSTFHDNTTNNSRITIPSGKDGYYQINGWASPTGNATGVRAVTICKNVALTVLADSSLAAVSASSIGFGVNVVANLVAGDYLQLVVYQTSGISLNYNYESFVTYFSVTYLGA